MSDGMTYKFRITYQHGETGRITERFITLGEPIPYLGDDWAVIAKEQYTGIDDKNKDDLFVGDKIQFRDRI